MIDELLKTPRVDGKVESFSNTVLIVYRDNEQFRELMPLVIKDIKSKGLDVMERKFPQDFSDEQIALEVAKPELKDELFQSGASRQKNLVITDRTVSNALQEQNPSDRRDISSNLVSLDSILYALARDSIHGRERQTAITAKADPTLTNLFKMAFERTKPELVFIASPAFNDHTNFPELQEDEDVSDERREQIMQKAWADKRSSYIESLVAAGLERSQIVFFGNSITKDDRFNSGSTALREQLISRNLGTLKNDFDGECKSRGANPVNTWVLFDRHLPGQYLNPEFESKGLPLSDPPPISLVLPLSDLVRTMQRKKLLPPDYRPYTPEDGAREIVRATMEALTSRYDISK